MLRHVPPVASLVELAIGFRLCVLVIIEVA
jgi:hypothetical protein